MALVVQKTTGGREYKVKNLSQADFGCLEIERAEVEMPGLMACRAEFSPSQPLKGARITDLMLSWSCTSHGVALLDLWSEKGTGKYENKVYDMPEHLEKKVSALHVPKLLDASVATSGEPKKSDKIKRILKVMGAKAYGVFGMVARSLINYAHEWGQS